MKPIPLPTFFQLATFLLLVTSSARAVEPAFRMVEIDAKIDIGYGLAIGDVNGDGQPDILLADKRRIFWYENPSWERHLIVENLTPLDHVCLAAADIDNDGKVEIAAGAQWNPGDTVNSGAVFYLIPPSDRTQRWSPVALPHEPTVHRMRWVKNASGKFDLVVVPLHGRGNKDGQGAGVRILAYHLPADPRQPWTTELIDDSLHLTHNFNPVQWDDDAGQELIVAGKEGIFLFDQGSGHWQKLQLGGESSGQTGFTGAGEVRTGKLPRGERFLATIEPMHGNKIVVYTPPSANTSMPLWHRHVLDDTLVDGHAVVCGDFLQQGSDQVVVGWRAMGKPSARVGLRLYIPQDDPNKAWKQVLIDDNQMACEDALAADLNGDGRLDLVAAGRATKNVRIYWNETGKSGN